MSLIHVDAMRKIAMTMPNFTNIQQEGVTIFLYFFEPNQDLEKETEGERREAKLKAHNLFNRNTIYPSPLIFLQSEIREEDGLIFDFPI